jgi:hypothetical protein
MHQRIDVRDYVRVLVSVCRAVEEGGGLASIAVAAREIVDDRVEPILGNVRVLAEVEASVEQPTAGDEVVIRTCEGPPGTGGTRPSRAPNLSQCTRGFAARGRSGLRSRYPRPSKKAEGWRASRNPELR